MQRMVSHWFMIRLELIDKLPASQIVTPKAESIISRRNVKGLKMRITPLNLHGEYQVSCEDTDVFVDLEMKQCSCRKFDIDRMPCRHALACCGHVGINLYSLCSTYYKIETWADSYAGTVYSVLRETKWMDGNAVD